MTKSGKIRDLPLGRAEGLIRVGEAERYPKEEKSPVVPPKKKKPRKKSPFYDSRQMRVGKRRYQRKTP